MPVFDDLMGLFDESSNFCDEKFNMINALII